MHTYEKGRERIAYPLITPFATTKNLRMINVKRKWMKPIGLLLMINTCIKISVYNTVILISAINDTETIYVSSFLN